MAVDHKKRSWVSVTVTGRRRPSQFHDWENYSFSGQTNVEESTGTLNGRLNGRWTGGGPWFLSRNVLDYGIGQGQSGTFDGTAYLSSSTTGVVSPTGYTTPSDAQLIIDGTKAIAATTPTSPIADLAVTMAELRREGLPSPLLFKTWESRTLRAKNAGDEYLNHQFGWAPLVREINNFAYAVDKSDQILAKYQSEANKPIKRSFRFPTLSDTTYQPSAYVCIPANAGFATGGGQTTFRTQEKWFEGTYIYYLPTGGSFTDKIQRHGSHARKLLGISLTPEVLWNLTPWSWASDWFVNTGDILHNLTAFRTDGLVLQQGHIMCHTRKRLYREGVNPLCGPMYSDSLVETKVRLNATPYGFGISYAGLSPRQLAVLAALGISKW
jgi:hypothetical protein